MLLVSEDEGSHRHVSNVLSDPVYLGHHPVHFVKVLTYRRGMGIENVYLCLGKVIKDIYLL